MFFVRTEQDYQEIRLQNTKVMGKEEMVSQGVQCKTERGDINRGEDGKDRQ